MQQQGKLNNEPIFSRRKSLLTVGQYATRQGVSTGVVQECARLGVVQVRKHRDKTYIVDLPLNTYDIIKQQDSLPPEAIDVESCSNKITELVSRVLKPQNDIRPSPAAPARNQRTHKEKLAPVRSVPAAMPALDPLVVETKKVTDDKNKNAPPPDRFRITPLRSITDSVKIFSLRKVFFILVTTAFVISLFAFAWVSIDRKIQQHKLQQAYDSITRLMSKYEETRQQARLYELDMMGWRADAEQAKKALLNSESELQSARRNLYEARKDLQTIQLYNTEKLKELNDQITRIRSNLPAAGK